MWCVREKERMINLWIIAASHVLSFAQEVLHVFYLAHLILTTTFWGRYDYYHSYFIAEEIETWRSDIWARPQIWEVVGQGTYAGKSLPFWLRAEGVYYPPDSSSPYSVFSSHPLLIFGHRFHPSLSERFLSWFYSGKEIIRILHFYANLLVYSIDCRKGEGYI